MAENFDTVQTPAGSGGTNLAGDEISQGGQTKFVPACYLVFGPQDGPYVRVNDALGQGLPVQNDGTGKLTVTWADVEKTVSDPFSGGDVCLVGCIRNDTLTTLSEVDGDITVFRVNSQGALWVALDSTSPLAVTQAASSQADGHSVTLGARTDTAATSDTGTFSLIALLKRLLSRITALLPAALTGSGNFKIAIEESNVLIAQGQGQGGGGSWAQDLTHYGGSAVGATNGIHVHPSTSAVFRVSDGGGSLSVDDGGNVLSVDDAGSTLSVDDAGSSLSVDDGGNVLSVDDAGSSLTVDGEVSVVIETPGGQSAMDDTADAVKCLLVDTSGSGISASNALFVSPGNSAEFPVTGTTAHDATFPGDTSGNPIFIGGYSSSSAPTSVSANGDAVRAWFLRNGQQAVSVVSGSGVILSQNSGLIVSVGASSQIQVLGYASDDENVYPLAGSYHDDPVDLCILWTNPVTRSADDCTDDTADAVKCLPVDGQGQSITEDTANAIRTVHVDSGGTIVENETLTGLSSSTRTSTTTTSELSNKGHRGIIVFLNVTAASGTGGLTPRILGVNIGGQQFVLSSYTGVIITTGQYILELSPGASGTGGDVIARDAGQLPGSFKLQVTHADATNYTYSVDYCLVL